MIRFGPSGIPLSCKGRTQRDAIDDLHTLSLNAMEIQFIRAKTSERYLTEEEIGLRPLEMSGDIVVEVLREDKNGNLVPMPNLNIKLEKGDVVRTLVSGIGDDQKDLRDIGVIARDVDIKLSLHAPYYMDLCGNEEMAKSSMDYLKWSGIIANGLGIDLVVTHIGMYGEMDKEQAYNVAKERIKKILLWYAKQNFKIKIGVENSGKQKVLGSIDEIMRLTKEVKGTIPIMNFAHHHAREYGALKNIDDFRNIFKRLEEIKQETYYTHFSGVEHEGGNEKRCTPVKKGDLKFELLAECLAEEDYDITLISSSPLLEHDAMYMKVMLERLLVKKEMKTTRVIKDRYIPMKPKVKQFIPFHERAQPKRIIKKIRRK